MTGSEKQLKTSPFEEVQIPLPGFKMRYRHPDLRHETWVERTKKGRVRVEVRIRQRGEK